MALHACYRCENFADTIVYIINMLGDADTTGSMAGQMAGAFYGYQSILNSPEPAKYMLTSLQKWDNYAFELHGVCLYCLGLRYDDAAGQEFKRQGVAVSKVLADKSKSWLSKLFS